METSIAIEALERTGSSDRAWLVPPNQTSPEPSAAPGIVSIERPRERSVPATARAHEREPPSMVATALLAPAASRDGAQVVPASVAEPSSGAVAHTSMAPPPGSDPALAAGGRALPKGPPPNGAGRGNGTGASGANGPSSASSSNGSDARARLLARYLERVRSRVAQHRGYPHLARRANLEGTICLRIAIEASGSVLGVTPTCGTSAEPLLQAALESVSSAAPFPPLPAALGARLTLDVPVVFELDSL
jgi:protein TonB